MTSTVEANNWMLPQDTPVDVGFHGPDLAELLEGNETLYVKPTGYHLLIKIREREEKTITGIYRPDEYRLREQVASVLATVVEVGPEAFLDKDRFPSGQPWCKAGDTILIHPYTGSRFQIRMEDGAFDEFRILEDRHVLAVVSKEMVDRVDRINAA